MFLFLSVGNQSGIGRITFQTYLGYYHTFPAIASIFVLFPFPVYGFHHFADDLSI
jgi:hypothetical protein